MQTFNARDVKIFCCRKLFAWVRNDDFAVSNFFDCWSDFFPYTFPTTHITSVHSWKHHMSQAVLTPYYSFNAFSRYFLGLTRPFLGSNHDKYDKRPRSNWRLVLIMTHDCRLSYHPYIWPAIGYGREQVLEKGMRLLFFVFRVLPRDFYHIRSLAKCKSDKETTVILIPNWISKRPSI